MLLFVYSIYYIFIEIIFCWSIEMLLYFIFDTKILLFITLVALTVVVRSWQQRQVLQKQIYKYAISIAITFPVFASQINIFLKQNWTL